MCFLVYSYSFPANQDGPWRRVGCRLFPKACEICELEVVVVGMGLFNESATVSGTLSEKISHFSAAAEQV